MLQRSMTHIDQDMQAILVPRFATFVRQDPMSLMTSGNLSSIYKPGNFLEGSYTIRVPGELKVIYCNRVLKPLTRSGTS